MTSFQAVETTASGAVERHQGRGGPLRRAGANCVIIANYSAAREGDGFKPLNLTKSANAKMLF